MTDNVMDFNEALLRRRDDEHGRRQVVPVHVAAAALADAEREALVDRAIAHADRVKAAWLRRNGRATS